MNPVHILTASSPSALADSINALIAARDVALFLRAVTLTDGRACAVVVELPASRSVPGSMLEVRVEETSDPAGLVAGLAAENPFWSVESAFATGAPGAKKKPAGITVVAVLRQP